MCCWRKRRKVALRSGMNISTLFALCLFCSVTRNPPCSRIFQGETIYAKYGKANPMDRSRKATQRHAIGRWKSMETGAHLNIDRDITGIQPLTEVDASKSRLDLHTHIRSFTCASIRTFPSPPRTSPLLPSASPLTSEPALPSPSLPDTGRPTRLAVFK